MPYIKAAQRLFFEDTLDIVPSLDEPGELNYVITSLCGQYLKENGISYNTINDVIGVLECAKLELYRRLAAPYEDSKMLENGDIPLYARRRQ
jgi:hypothetical protein